jgi:phage-related minor tail protein
MKLVDSQFDKNDNSVDALTAKNQVLEKSIDSQKQKIVN